MANKRTPLGSDDLNLERLDLEMLDDDLELGGSGTPSGPIREFATSFKRGFLEQTRARVLLRGFLRTGLPDGYSRAYMAAEAVGREGQLSAQEVRRRAAPELAELTRQTETLLPRLKERAPKRLYRKVEDRLKALREDLEAEAYRGPTAQQSQAQRDEATLAEAMHHTLEVQRDLSRAEEEAAQERYERDRTERGIRQRVEEHRFDQLTRQGSRIADAVERQVSYQDQVTHQYQRKSLELQYRSYFALRDLRKYAETTQVLHRDAYRSLVHNTGLPDHLKFQAGERASLEARRGLAGIAGDAAKRSLSEFLGNYYPQMAAQVRDQITAMVTNLSTGVSMAGAGMGMAGSMGGSKAGMAGTTGGGMAGDFFTNTLAPMLFNQLRPAMSRASDRFGGGQHHNLSYWMQNAPAMIQEYATDLNQSYGWRGTLQDVIRSIAPSYFLEDRVQDGSFQTIDRQTAFNQLSQRSLVEIIPGYLSRILQEARMIRTGRDDIEREVYDVATGRFTTQTGAQGSLLKQLVTPTQQRMVRTTLDEVVDQYDPEGKLSREAREALGERLMRDAATNGYFDPTQYASGQGYTQGTPDAVLDELSGHFNQRFALGEGGELLGTAENRALRNELSKAFLELRNVIPTTQDQIRRVVGAGSQEMIRDLGLMSSSHGENRINYDRLWELFRGDGVLEEDGPLPPADARLGSAMERRSEIRKRQREAGQKRSAFDRAKDWLHAAGPEAVDEPSAGTGTETHEEVVPKGIAQQFSARTAHRRDTGGQVRGEYTEYLDKLYRLQQRDYRESSSFHDLVRQALTDGLKIRELPALRWSQDGEEGAALSTDGKGTSGPGLARRMMRGLGRYYGHLWDGMGKGVSGVLGGAGQAAGGLLGLFGRPVMDIYVRGREEPVLLARDLKAGLYVDVDSGKPITRVNDITGEVRDTEGNIVLTREEVAQGLYDRRGQSLLRKSVSHLLDFYNNAWLKPGAAMIASVPKAMSFVSDMLMPERDAYVAGETTPRLLARLLKRGEYLDEATMTPLQSYKDITGNVVDRHGNVVLTAEELPRLVGRDGRPLESLGTRAGHLLRAGVSLPVNTARGTLRWAGRVMGKLGDLASAGVDRLSGLLRGKRRGAREGYTPWEDESLALLSGIYQVLDTRLPGKPLREGSWQSILKKRREEKADKAEGSQIGKYAATGGLLGGLGGGLRKLYDMFRGRNQKEDEDEGGISDAAKGGMAGAAGAWMAGKAGGAARWLGRGLGSAGAWLGRGGIALGAGLGKAALAGLAGLTSIVGAPVLLGGAAALAAGAAGYTYYKRRQAASGVFRELRLTQYGQSPNGWSRPGKLLEVEALFDEITSRNGREAVFDMAKFDPQALVEILGIDLDNEDDARAAGAWIEGRFKPVFMAYQNALLRLAPDVRLGEMDDKLDNDIALQILDRVSFPYSGNTPYAITASPFGADEVITITNDDIKRRVTAVKEAFDGTDEESERSRTASVVATGHGTRGIRDSSQRATEQGRDARAARETAARNVGIAAGLVLTDRREKDDQLTERAKAPRPVYGDNFQLTPLQAIRVRGYGVVTLQRSRVVAVLSLEDRCYDYLSYNADHEAVFNGSVSEMFETTAGLFGLSAAGADDEERERFTLWFRGRFLPVFLTYASAVRQHAPDAPLARADTRLGSVGRHAVGNAVMGATYTYQEVVSSVWQVPFVVFDDPQLGQARDLAKEDLALLEQESHEQELQAPAQQARGGKSRRGLGSQGGVSNAAIDAALGVSGKAPQRAYERAQQRWGMGGQSGYGTQGVEPPRQPGGSLSGRGNAFAGFAEGSGGQWEAIPRPKANKSRDAAMETLQAVQALTGVDANLLATFASIESAFDYNAKAPTSSATGWFQFINKTWSNDDGTGVFDKHASKYGIPMHLSRAEKRALRTDPRINALMGAEFLKENARYLEGRLGRPPTDTDLYLAHFFGPNGASNFLSQDSNATAATTFSTQAAANRNVFYKPSGQARTMGEVYAWADEKVGGHRRGGGVSVNQHAANDEPDPLSSGSVVQLGPAGTEGAFASADTVDPALTPAVTPLNQRVGGTVNPLNTTAGGNRHVPLDTAPSDAAVNDEEVIGTGSPDEREVVTYHDRVRQQAAMADRRDQVRGEQTAEYTREMGTLLHRQLEVQESMRDYLRVIAETFGGIQRDGMKVKPDEDTEASRRANDTSRAPQSTRPVQASANTPAPIAMRR